MNVLFITSIGVWKAWDHNWNNPRQTNWCAAVWWRTMNVRGGKRERQRERDREGGANWREIFCLERAMCCILETTTTISTIYIVIDGNDNVVTSIATDNIYNHFNWSWTSNRVIQWNSLLYLSLSFSLRLYSSLSFSFPLSPSLSLSISVITIAGNLPSTLTKCCNFMFINCIR